MNLFEKAYIDGELQIWVPDGCNKTLEELLNEPIDVLYITRRQVEREQNIE